MPSTPLVSVICLCHNHEDFVLEALRSVTRQIYSHIQLIIVDDASDDSSRSIIEEFITKGKSHIDFIPIKQNIGNCAAFNKGLAIANGKYVIDFSTDDVMLPQMIESQVSFFEPLADDYGVIYCDAEYIDENGNKMGRHFGENELMKACHPYEGNVYEQLVSEYFIPTPTMMIRKSVLAELGGYDESLAYEDFDFWVRSARKYKYAYLNLSLMRIRRTTNSLSSLYYIKEKRLLESTYQVCCKIKEMNCSKMEDQALVKRLKYEARHAVFMANFDAAKKFLRLLAQLGKRDLSYWLLLILTKLRLDFSFIRKVLAKNSHRS